MRRAVCNVTATMVTGAALLAIACGGRAQRQGPDTVVVIEDPAANACGGAATLTGAPGQSCDEQCGALACDGTEALRCVPNGSARNACGTCGPLPREECNGRDDDCDGLIDEQCVTSLGEADVARIRGDRVILGGAAGVDLLDLKTGAKEHLTDDVPAAVAFSDEWAAWTVLKIEAGTLRSGAAYGRRLATGQTGRLTPPDLVATGPIAVDRGRVVFAARSATGIPRVYLWDPSSPVPRPVGTSMVNEDQPDLGGDWLVFVRGAGPQVVARNLSNDVELVLSENLQGAHTQPSIAEGRVVWTRQLTRDTGVQDRETFVYDLATRQRNLLGPVGSAQARTDGAMACWSNNPGNVTVADLRRYGRKILSGMNGGAGCDVSGRRVIWIERTPPGPSIAVRRDLLDHEP